MLNKVWQGVKWFFTPVNFGKQNKVTRKHNFSHRPVEDGNHVIKVTEPPKNDSIVDMYTKILQVAEQEGRRERDAVEHAKGELWIPHGITTEHKEYILQVCGFQKTHLLKGEHVYDPRLIQAINMAMNMYSIEVSNGVLKILDTVNKD